MYMERHGTRESSGTNLSKSLYRDRISSCKPGSARTRSTYDGHRFVVVCQRTRNWSAGSRRKARVGCTSSDSEGQPFAEEERQDGAQPAIAVFAGESATLLPVFCSNGSQPTGMVIDQRIGVTGDEFNPSLILNIDFDWSQG
jgi:hypothetical protein